MSSRYRKVCPDCYSLGVTWVKTFGCYKCSCGWEGKSCLLIEMEDGKGRSKGIITASASKKFREIREILEKEGPLSENALKKRGYTHYIISKYFDLFVNGKVNVIEYSRGKL